MNSILTIVIPALNEENAVGGTIERCLSAAGTICSRGALSDIEVIVVSDGSTDRTAEIARAFAAQSDKVSVIIFEENRGYGAAIKAGFERGKGDLVGFIDADGTCDPLVFGDLCGAIRAASADIALGTRMGALSKMPVVRRIGNTIFALLLGFLSGEAVTDTASGMRVLRRDRLPELYPLPDGLDFTPAMSARAVMQRLRIAEVPMAYSERIGHSKLRAVKDGIRFFRAIIHATLFYRPSRLFTLWFSLCALLAVMLALSPTEFYLRNHAIEDWMIYRFVACLLLGGTGFTALCSAVIADELLRLTSQRTAWRSFGAYLLNGLFSTRSLLGLSLLATTAAAILVWPGAVQYYETRHVTLHWSRVIVAAFGFWIAIESIVTASLLTIIGLWRSTLSGKREASPLTESAHAAASQQAGEAAEIIEHRA